MFQEPLRFTTEFPVPDRAAWRAAVDATLKGRPYDSLAWAFDDGAPIEPLVTAADIAGLPHLADAPRSWLRGAAGWSSRELIVHPDPAEAGRAARAALDDGADEIEFGLDQLAHDALEPGQYEPPGVSGIAVHGLEDMRALLGGINLAATRIGISAGEGALATLAFALAVADEHGIAAADLQLDLEFDPIARLTQRQAELDDEDPPEVCSQRASPGAIFDELAVVLQTCRQLGAGVRPLAIDGQVSHLSGADAALELAFTIATLVETARQLEQRDVSFDDFAPAATVRVQVSHEILSEIAKLRALRLLWAKVAHGCGATDLAAYRPRIHGMTSGRSRAFRFDLRTNLLRTTLATFAAATGGCDSILVLPFDEDPAHQDDATRRLARHQHHLLRHESHLGEIADPAGGAFAVEALTHRIATEAWRHLQNIESRGGIIQAMRDGSLHATHSDMVGARTADFATRRRTLVGINRFVDHALEGPPTGDAATWQRTLDAGHRALLARAEQRDADAARATLAAVNLDDGLLRTITAAARAGATTSEISQATWPPVGVEFRHRFAPIAIPDGEEFEELRDAMASSDALVARIVMLDQSRTARQRADLARSVFTAGGWIVDDSVAPAQAMTTATQAASPAAIVLCADGDGWVAAARDATTPIVVVAPPKYGHDVLFLHDGADFIQLLVTLTGEADDS